MKLGMEEGCLDALSLGEPPFLNPFGAASCRNHFLHLYNYSLRGMFRCSNRSYPKGFGRL
jgi:hypothetical protein